jgi:acyl-CoA reductase-like NAD-dependent aldehyde dehydrogenase
MPAQLTPHSAVILAEITDVAGVPAGVFNLVNDRGSVIGNTLSSHPDSASSPSPAPSMRLGRSRSPRHRP